MRIVDAHTHLATWPDVPSAETNLLAGMERHGIAASLVSHADCTSFPGEHEAKIEPLSQEEGLRQCIDFARRNPGRIYVAAWFTPLRAAEPSAEFIRLIQDNRDIVKALKFHPYLERCRLDDRRVEPYLRLAAELDLPVLVHTAVDEYSSIGAFVHACREHPSIGFVAAHLELLSDHEFAIDALKGVHNAWGDTAWVDLYHAKKAMDVLGKDRVFFGSDSPINGNATLDDPMYLEFFRNALNLDGYDYEGLMGRNAANFYGLF